MAINQDISNLPTPPSRSDSPSDFSDKADSFLGSLPTLQTELNTYADEANSTQTAVNTSASNAATSEQNAAQSASDAEGFADAAAAVVGAVAWDAGTTFNTNDAAIGSDGNTYRSLVDNNTGNDPVIGDGSKWLNLTGGAEVTKGSLSKTFIVDETEQISLSESIDTSPVVSVVKEVPQDGVSTNNWFIDGTPSKYEVENTAYSTTITPSSTFGDITLTLGSGFFSSDDVGKTVLGNGGQAFLRDTSGSASVIFPFNDTSTISSGEWTLQGVLLDGDSARLSYNSIPENLYDVFNDGSSYAAYTFFNDTANDLGNSFDGSWQGNEQYASGTAPFSSRAALFDGNSAIICSSNFLDNKTVATFSFWATFGDVDVGENRLFSKSFFGSASNRWSLYVEDAQTITVQGGNSVYSDRKTLNTTLNSGQTYHFIFIADGPTYSLYIDNQLQFSETKIDNYLNNNSFAFIIGGYNDANDGSSAALFISQGSIIDDFRVFDKALNSSERQKLFLVTGGGRLNQYESVVTSEGGQIDSEFWTDLNELDVFEEDFGESVFYALSNDNKTTFYVFDSSLPERKIVRNNSGTWEINTDTTYDSETWQAAQTNNIYQALNESMSISNNQMDKSKIESIQTNNFFNLQDKLDIAIILFSSVQSLSPFYHGTEINYDANIKNKGALNGIDYEWDQPEPSTVRIKSLSNENLKIRVL